MVANKWEQHIAKFEDLFWGTHPKQWRAKYRLGIYILQRIETAQDKMVEVGCETKESEVKKASEIEKIKT